MSIVNNANLKEMYPSFNTVTGRFVLLTVWNMDGSTSEMRFSYPPFCFNGDDQNRAGQYLEEWARDMTRFYLQITAYQVHFGTVYNDGSETISSWFHKKEVPLNKVFISKKINQGKWVTPAAAKKQAVKKQRVRMRTNIREGRNLLSGVSLCIEEQKNVQSFYN